MTLLEELELGALTAIVTAATADEPALEAMIATGEADLQAGLVNLIKNIPMVKGALAMIVGPLEATVEAGLEAYAATLIAKYTPKQIFMLIIGGLTALEKQV
jgi:hypothetical protein